MNLLVLGALIFLLGILIYFLFFLLGVIGKSNNIKAQGISDVKK